MSEVYDQRESLHEATINHRRIGTDAADCPESVKKWREDAFAKSRDETLAIIHGETASHIKRDLAHVPTDKLKSLAETYERKLKIIGNSGSPEATKLRFRFEFIMQEIGIRQIVEDVEADLAKVGQ